MVLYHKTKNNWKKAKISNLENQAMSFVDNFLIHNSGTKIFPDKNFLQNASQE